MLTREERASRRRLANFTLDRLAEEEIAVLRDRGEALAQMPWVYQHLCRHLYQSMEIVKLYRAGYEDDDLFAEGDRSAVFFSGQAFGLGEAVRLIAVQYKDHPQYEAEWRP